MKARLRMRIYSVLHATLEILENFSCSKEVYFFTILVPAQFMGPDMINLNTCT